MNSIYVLIDFDFALNMKYNILSKVVIENATFAVVKIDNLNDIKKMNNTLYFIIPEHLINYFSTPELVSEVSEQYNNFINKIKQRYFINKWIDIHDDIADVNKKLDFLFKLLKDSSDFSDVLSDIDLSNIEILDTNAINRLFDRRREVIRIKQSVLGVVDVGENSED